MKKQESIAPVCYGLCSLNLNHYNNVMPSSVIREIIYDAASATLRIVFVSGLVYDYKDVPENVYQLLKTSGSKGTYLNKHIKNNYSFKKVTE